MVATYEKSVETKLRNLDPKVENQYLQNNNLPFRLKLALKTIKMLISEQMVVVCRTDKDGKILIVNYSDYHEIMKKELNKFDVHNSLHRLCINNLKLINANAKSLSSRCLIKQSYQKIYFIIAHNIELKKTVIKK